MLGFRSMKGPGDGVVNRAPNNRVCKSCGVAMWLIEMRGSTKTYIYECKTCNGRMEVDGKLVR